MEAFEMSKAKKKTPKTVDSNGKRIVNYWDLPDTFPGKDECPKCGSLKWVEQTRRNIKGKVVTVRCSDCPVRDEHH